MKLIVSKPRAVAVLVVSSAAISACASSQKQLTAPQQAAAQAEEHAQKAQNEAQKAREQSDKAQQNLAEAQQTHNEAKQAELMADQRATEASRRAAVAEAQAGLAAKPAALPPASEQAQGAQKSEKGVAEAQGHQGNEKVKVITASLLFKTGSAELMPSAQSQLDDVAQALSAQPQANDVKVQGYTDNTGSAAVNDPLSKKRAQTVADYLESKGVSKDRITVEGFGDKDPVSSANTTEGHALNRRVDITVEPVEGRAMPQGQQPQKGQPSQSPPSQPPPSQPPPKY